jgi:hypothetical protein
VAAAKKTEPKAAAAAEPEPVKGPADPWSPSWGIERRMLEARRKLKGTKLWKEFEGGDKNFDAFSIHTLANGVEEVLGEVGVISSFSVTRWTRSGNTTVVEGLIRVTAVDGQKGQLEYVCVGEGVDDGDKGLGKAVSYARKLGMISAMNLGIGIDNEATRERAQPQPQPERPTMSGAPQQHSTNHGANGASNGAAKPGPSMNDFINGSEPQQPAQSQKMYTLQVAGLKARGVLTSGMQQEVWVIVSNSPTTEALDGWVNLNEGMLQEFSNDNPAIGNTLYKIVQAKRAALAEKGL